MSEENTSKVPWTVGICDVKVDIKVIKVADGKLMGIAVDLSPNYYNYLEPYRRLHPSSRFGLPGRLIIVITFD